MNGAPVTVVRDDLRVTYQLYAAPAPTNRGGPRAPATGRSWLTPTRDPETTLRVDIVTGSVPLVGSVANSLPENGEPLEAVLLSPSRVLTPRCEHRATVVAAVRKVSEDAAVATVICVPEDFRVGDRR
jgi:hypothetical protein